MSYLESIFTTGADALASFVWEKEATDETASKAENAFSNLQLQGGQNGVNGNGESPFVDASGWGLSKVTEFVDDYDEYGNKIGIKGVTKMVSKAGNAYSDQQLNELQLSGIYGPGESTYVDPSGWGLRMVTEFVEDYDEFGNKIGVKSVIKESILFFDQDVYNRNKSGGQ